MRGRPLHAMAVSAVLAVSVLLVAPVPAWADEGGGTGTGPRSRYTLSGHEWMVPVFAGCAVMIAAALIAVVLSRRGKGARNSEAGDQKHRRASH